MYGPGLGQPIDTAGQGGSSAGYGPYGIPPGLWAAMQTWTPEQRESFIQQWRAQQQGDGTKYTEPIDQIGPPGQHRFRMPDPYRRRYYYPTPELARPTGQPTRVETPTLASRGSDPNTSKDTSLFATVNGEAPAELAAGDAGSWVLPLSALGALYFFFLRK